MDFKQLQTFVTVADLGSFTRAASVLGVAQPALSRQVRALEVELRQPLFERNGRGVTLTAAGQRLLGHGRGILQQLERARHDLEDQRGAASGLLSIGLPPSVSRTLTAPLVDAFRARFPRATLTVVEGLSTYALEWLAQGRIDCAVVYNATPAAAFDLQPVLEERLFLVSARPAGGPPHRAAGPAADAGRAGHARTRHPQPAARHAHAPGNGAGRSRPETARGAGNRQRAGHAGPGAAPPAARGAGHQRHPRQRARGLLPRPPHRRVAPGLPPLAATLWIATSAQRPRGPLLEQAVPLLAQQLHERLGMADSSQAPPAGPASACDAWRLSLSAPALLRKQP